MRRTPYKAPWLYANEEDQQYRPNGNPLLRSFVVSDSAEAIGIALRNPGIATIANIPAMAYAIGKAQRGDKLATFAGAAAGGATGYGVGTLIAGGIVAFGAPEILAGIAAAGLVMYPSYEIGRAVRGTFRRFSQIEGQIRRLELGGSYEDTATAKNLRIRAVADMNAAMGNSRRYLGREALYLHR